MTGRPQHLGKELPSSVDLAISDLEFAYVKHNDHARAADDLVTTWLWHAKGLLKEHTDGWTTEQWSAVQRELVNVKNSVARGAQHQALPDLRSPHTRHMVPILGALEDAAVAARRLEEALHSGLGEDHYDRSLSRRRMADDERFGSHTSRRY
ncbi:hypothetical protein JCM3775_003639 [Rhodotorula graminis]|uniref:Uncharacterized protein n=1 Tax=Rhodotorula graminis (strain WP1) TaxID=578459 RepID=A0A194S124_RHOGW|nr:uncharacterized protein RHOBADRAFT_44918 [Rhodotorula graminis WP1]KPV74428.1 hypothetical protein RHOBADRAFT_44918 [Rhodotorula graminis WP1]